MNRLPNTGGELIITLTMESTLEWAAEHIAELRAKGEDVTLWEQSYNELKAAYDARINVGNEGEVQE